MPHYIFLAKALDGKQLTTLKVIAKSLLTFYGHGTHVEILSIYCMQSVKKTPLYIIIVFCTGLSNFLFTPFLLFGVICQLFIGENC